MNEDKIHLIIFEPINNTCFIAEYVVAIKDNLNNQVEISREAMSNCAKGLEKINDMIADYRTRPIANDPPLGEKQKKKCFGGWRECF